MKLDDRTFQSVSKLFNNNGQSYSDLHYKSTLLIIDSKGRDFNHKNYFKTLMLVKDCIHKLF